jgi:hypothetical protein
MGTRRVQGPIQPGPGGALMKPEGTAQLKAKKWNTTQGRDKNYALAAYRKWKKIEKQRKAAEQERYNSLCGEVTISHVSK